MHKRINITFNQNMWHDMAIIILSSWSPSPKHFHNLQRHRRDTLISIIASLSSRQLLLLRLSLPLSDIVKQLHGDCIAYNKATTIWLLPVADNFVTKHDHLIQQFISHHAWPYHITASPAKTKLDILYFLLQVLQGCYGLLARTILTYASKPQRFFIKCAALTFNKDRT